LFALRQVLFEQTQDSLSFTIKSKQDSLLQAANKAEANRLAILNQENQLQIKDLAIKEQESKAKIQGLIILMVAIGLVLMVFLALVMFRANRTRKKANIKLEKQNKEIAEKSEQLGLALKKIAHQNQNITQSINYAQGIQRALLPKTEQLNDFIKDAFILFKPRDIVSGDFYWFREIDAQSNIFKIFGMHRREDDTTNKKKQAKKFVVSAVDCTGHGVPGAFMSMIGYNLLDEITNKGITRPDLILEELHRGVRFALKQKETNNQDGMDMAICVIDKEKKFMEFAGAKNPLIYIQNGEVQQIKGDKNGIGGKLDDHKFEAHTIDVSQPTWVYMFTDGYIDQFGGDQGRKFMIKNFRELLLEIHTMPMNQQKEYLDKAIKDWIGTKYSQIDDLLVWGFKLDLNGVS
jgi:serine phosphatase RsbU (regulator of sigma subunit)